MAACVDLTAVAIGAVEGADEVAHLVERGAGAVLDLAVRAAVEVAAAQGTVAANRVHQAVVGSPRSPGVT